MTRRDKLLAAAQNNPAGLRFDDFETLLSRSGWTLDHQGGSHRIWYSPQGSRLPIQEGQAGKAKPYQVKQFLTIYQRENP
ncbi:MAG: type II toxin-antitoxin system HicA family toxin [Candidatus Competibacteraceae bacterium]|nr:type II toxin-antitoxin system HicA family toxin [Candidatus Competibacteraceae bacterium]MBK8750935.1 type II toxin-antitoxin system HicA family toxin [Candidatus Competibacteraceae bacterium]